jgi:uncharacterized protein involved in type VI secretion and phage assembly
MLMQSSSIAMRENSGQMAGVAPATVTQNNDPEGLARVKLKFHWRSDGDETDWVRIVTPMGGKERGLMTVPEVGDEVLVAFDRNDVRFPYVLGALWNKEHRPPENNAQKKNDVRLIKTRKGHILQFDDGEKGEILIKLNDGKKIIIDDAGIKIDDKSNKIELDTISGSVLIEAKMKLSIKAPSISIEAKTALELKGGAALNANATMVKIN